MLCSWDVDMYLPDCSAERERQRVEMRRRLVQIYAACVLCGVLLHSFTADLSFLSFSFLCLLFFSLSLSLPPTLFPSLPIPSHSTLSLHPFLSIFHSFDPVLFPPTNNQPKQSAKTLTMDRIDKSLDDIIKLQREEKKKFKGPPPKKTTIPKKTSGGVQSRAAIRATRETRTTKPNSPYAVCVDPMACCSQHDTHPMVT